MFRSGDVDAGARDLFGGGGGPAPTQQGPTPPPDDMMEEDNPDRPCASGPVITLGVGLDLSFGTGFSLDGGVAFDFGESLIPTISLFGSSGRAYGIDLSLGLSFGGFNSIEGLRGDFSEAEVGILSGSLSAVFDADGNLVGIVGTAGPGVPVSARVSEGSGGTTNTPDCVRRGGG